MIPVEWTDLAVSVHPREVPASSVTSTLGSLEDLLRARAIADALLSRRTTFNNANANATASKESVIAKESHPLRSSSP